MSNTKLYKLYTFFKTENKQKKQQKLAHRQANKEGKNISNTERKAKRSK